MCNLELYPTSSDGWRVFVFAQNIVCYPMMGEKMFNVAAFVGTPGGKVPEDAKYDGPWVTAVSAADVAAQFTLWDENVQGILKVRLRPDHWPSLVAEQC